MNSKLIFSGVLSLFLAGPVGAQSAQQDDKGKEGDPKTESFDGYGGASRQGTGPGLTVTGSEDKPNRENVQTEKKKKAQKKKAIDKMKKKDGGAEKTGG